MIIRTVKFKDFVEFPPQVRLESGEEYDFIPMEKVKPGTKYVQDSDFKVYTGGGAKFSNGDTIFARITPCLENNKIAKIKNLEKNIGFGSTEYFVFRAKDGISDPDYIYYLAKSDIIRQPAIKSMVGASGRQRADKGVVENIEILDLPLITQQRIGSILSTYDDLIENNQKRIMLLEEAAQNIYREWFVHLRFPGHESATWYVDDNGRSLPEGWEFNRTDKVFNINIGKTPPREEEQWFENGDGTGVKWVSIKDLNSSATYIFNTSERISEQGVDRFNMRDVSSGTVLLSFKLTVGVVAIATERMVTNEAIAHFNINDGSQIDGFYTYCYLKNFPYDILGSTSSIGRALNSQIIKAIPFLVPDDITIAKFTDSVKEIFGMIYNLLQQNNSLTEARDILLPRLMNQTIEV